MWLVDAQPVDAQPANGNSTHNIRQFAKSHYFDAAKLASALAFCGRVQDAAIVSLVQKHEPGRVLSSKYFYTIHIGLHKRGDRYELGEVDMAFLDNANVSLEYTRKALTQLGTINVPDSAKSHRLANPEYSSFFFIVQMYKVAKYHYVFFPIVVDYNVDVGIVHQCALIVDLHQDLFLFYEPYGVYSKYSAEYSGAVRDFLQLYKWPKFEYKTWHQHFGMSTGIQSILLRKHNDMKAEYVADKDNYMAKLKVVGSPRDELARSLAKKSGMPVHADDYTFDTLDIAYQYMRRSDEYDVDAFYLYYKYNSKTCVTITIIELDYFFSSLVDMDVEQQKHHLLDFYAEFEARLNAQLFDQLIKFARHFGRSSKLFSSINMPLQEICKK